MKKEELIRRLESARMPDLMVSGHKEHLRKILLERAAAEQMSLVDRRRGTKGWGLNGFGDWLRLPAWRTAAASALALIAIGVVLGLVFYVIIPSPAAIAENVVKNDPGIQHRLTGSGEIMIVRVEIKGGMASVVCGRSVGDFIEADVDLGGRSVVSMRRFEAIYMPELTAAAQEKAVSIASADPNVKALLEKGGTVGKIFPIFSSFSGATVVGNVLKVTPAATLAVVPVELDGRTWMVEVNIEQERTEHIIQPQKWQVFTVYYSEIPL